MRVFVDSNQFIADFAMAGAPFRYLLHFLSNSGSTLLLSRLVIEEVENKYAAEALKALGDAERSMQRLQQLGLTPSTGLLKSAPSVPPLNLEERIRKHVDGIEIVEYATVQHANVVQRALQRRKPFDSEGDVGYRDCLLWLSLLQHLSGGANGGSEEVMFISNNWRDFYETGPGKQGKSSRQGVPKSGALPTATDSDGHGGGLSLSAPGSKLGVQFHPDLIEDAQALACPVLPFESVAAFVDTKVDKKENVLNYEKKFDLFEKFLEESGLDVLRNLSSREAATVLQLVFSAPTASALTILSSDAEVFEGIEDFFIYVAEEVDKEIYVSCGYDLRILNVTLYIPRNQFDTHRSEIETAPHVWEVTPLDDTVAVRLSLRAYYQGSFSYDPVRQVCDGFSLHTFEVR